MVINLVKGLKEESGLKTKKNLYGDFLRSANGEFEGFYNKSSSVKTIGFRQILKHFYEILYS